MSTALAIYLLAGIVVDPFSRIAAAVLVLIAIVVLVVGAIVTFRDVLRRVLVNRSLLFNAGVVALVLVGLLRWAMGLAGQQERIMDVIPISMGYLPAVIALAALTVAGLLDFRYFRNWGALVAAGAIGFAGGIVPFMVHDSGFALVHLFPLIGVAMAQLWRSNWPKVEAKHATAILALPAAGLLGLLVLNTALSVRDLPADNAKLSEAMNSALEFNANELRLVQIARPSAIEQVGTRAGYDQMEQTSMLHSLTSSLTGAGWLAPVELLSIRKEQTWDYGAAVHLMHPFGRIGLLAYLLVVFAGILALYRARAALPEPPEGDTTSPVFLTIAGEMAAITLVFSAVYVSLGNLLLIPFTGRNLYLLAVLSVGDIVEALTLLALAALVITGARR